MDENVWGHRRLRPMPELHHRFTKPERERIMRLVAILERTEKKLEEVERHRRESTDDPRRIVGRESFLLADRGALRWALAILTADHSFPMGEIVEMARRVRDGRPITR